MAILVTGSLTSATASPSCTVRAGGTPLGFDVAIWGTFVATVRLEKSFDSGVTWLPITIGGAAAFTWTAPAAEQPTENENGVEYRFNCTAYTSGTINYRISQ